jgi:hypothetical protein
MTLGDPIGRLPFQKMCYDKCHEHEKLQEY